MEMTFNCSYFVNLPTHANVIDPNTTNVTRKCEVWMGVVIRALTKMQVVQEDIGLMQYCLYRHPSDFYMHGK